MSSGIPGAWRATATEPGLQLIPEDTAGAIEAVRRIVIPGAMVQIALATLLGVLIAEGAGWSLSTGLVLGLSVSVASTVVLLRALEGRNLMASVNGRIAVGWLIVEDLARVLALVMLPVIVELSQVRLRSRDAFWDIQVPKTHSIFDSH